MPEWNVTQNVVTIISIKEILFCAFFLYLYLRKKIKVFLWISLVLLISAIIVYVDIGVPYYIKLILTIILLLIALAKDYKEINMLEKSGKTVYQVLKPDKIDLFALIIFLIAWTLLKELILKH